MSKKNWEDYSKYLSRYSRKTDRVLQYFPINRIPQIKEERRDLREIIDLYLLRDRIIIALETLSEREKKVIIFRFGLDNGIAKTLREVGRLMGIPRERVHLIELKAMRKLRHLSRIIFIVDPSELKIKMDIIKEEEMKRKKCIQEKYKWLWDN